MFTRAASAITVTETSRIPASEDCVQICDSTSVPSRLTVESEKPFSKAREGCHLVTPGPSVAPAKECGEKRTTKIPQRLGRRVLEVEVAENERTQHAHKRVVTSTAKNDGSSVKLVAGHVGLLYQQSWSS